MNILDGKVERFLDELDLDGSQSVVVGCSGGVDSTALLATICNSRRFKTVYACYVDHQLHSSSAEHGSIVETTAEIFGAVYLRRLADPTIIEAGNGVEDGARRARYACFESCLQETGAEYLALGHHQADQVETFLIRLSQGSGFEGLGGMKACRFPIIRPFLEISKAEILAYAASLELHFATDPTNEDLRFLRNAIRLELAPSLDRVLGKGWRRHILNHMKALQGLMEAEHRRVIGFVESFVHNFEGGFVFRREHLSSLEPLTARHVVKALIADLSDVGPKRIQIEMVLDLAQSEKSVGKSQLSKDLWVILEYDRIFIGRIPPVLSGEVVIDAVGTYHWHDWTVEVGTECRNGLWLPLPTRNSPLLLRAVRAGDVLDRKSGRRKVSRILVDEKVPQRLRGQMMVIEQSGRILSVHGVRDSLAEISPEMAKAGVKIFRPKEFNNGS